MHVSATTERMKDEELQNVTQSPKNAITRLIEYLEHEVQSTNKRQLRGRDETRNALQKFTGLNKSTNRELQIQAASEVYDTEAGAAG